MKDGLDPSLMKEQFSEAYIKAVVSVAGLIMSKPSLDIDSIDWTISQRGGGGTTRSPRLDVQLKCTSRNVLGQVNITFPLVLKNYDDLRHENYQVPRILVVVIVPTDPETWLKQDETALAMNHCGYWLSLRGCPPTTSTSTVNVHLPRTQQFTVNALTDIMSRIGRQELP